MIYISEKLKKNTFLKMSKKMNIIISNNEGLRALASLSEV